MKTGENKQLILAGDIGGTKTNIGLFYRGRKGPQLKVMEQFSSPESPDLEKVLSGPGLVNIYAWLRDSGRYREPRWLAESLHKTDPARAITAAALDQKHPLCTAALDRFVSIFGAAGGNLALTVTTTGGVYLGGGIAPKILSELNQKCFMSAFTNKGRLKNFLEKIAVRVILNDKAALVGAASFALEMK